MITIDVEKREKAVIVSVAGNLSIGDIEKFEGPFITGLNLNPDVIALDLKNMIYLDSFGISRIVKISRRIIAGGTDFVLINLNDHINQILKIAMFDGIFNIMTIDEFEGKYFPVIEKVESGGPGK